MFGHRTSGVEDKTLRIDEVDSLPGLLLRQALKLEEAHQLHADTYSCGSSTEEQDLVIFERSAGGSGGNLGGVQESGEHDSAGSLNIIIEQRVLVAERLEEGERLIGGEILKLNDEVREDDGHLVHELFHQLMHLGLRNTRLAEAEVKRVFEEFFVIGADIDANGDGGRRPDTE